MCMLIEEFINTHEDFLFIEAAFSVSSYFEHNCSLKLSILSISIACGLWSCYVDFFLNSFIIFYIHLNTICVIWLTESYKRKK